MKILITGANRGIGLELARLCTARGDKVFAGCRSPQQARELNALAAQYPGQISILPMDITNEDSLDRCAQQVRAETDSLELLINNAAIYSEGESISTFDAGQASQVWMTNAVGPLMVVRHFLSLLKAGVSPRIINVSSEAGSITAMNHFRGYYYYSSKAALNMFTRCLSWDPDAAGITTIAIHPGWVRTDMGGADADISVTESASGILKVTASLTPEDNGRFFVWDGKEYPW